MKYLLIYLILLFSSSVLSCTEDGKGGVVEENDFVIRVDSKSTSGMTEERFNFVIDKIEGLYSGIISGFGAKLQIDRKWTSGKVNAKASRKGNTWTLDLFGGLARHPVITEDAFALIVCHELGHHIGGAPKYNSGTSAIGWASSEGQADYFASLKCLRKYFLNDDNSTVVDQLNAPEFLVSSCNKVHGGNDVNICIRGGMAGMSASILYAKLKHRPDPSFLTPDLSIVKKNLDTHPAHQCRLDTYFQGSVCEVGLNEDVDQKDEVRGTCHPKLGHTSGTRPRCWFVPDA